MRCASCNATLAGRRVCRLSECKGPCTRITRFQKTKNGPSVKEDIQTDEIDGRWTMPAIPSSQHAVCGCRGARLVWLAGSLPLGCGKSKHRSDWGRPTKLWLGLNSCTGSSAQVSPCHLGLILRTSNRKFVPRQSGQLQRWPARRRATPCRGAAHVMKSWPIRSLSLVESGAPQFQALRWNWSKIWGEILW